MLEHQGRESEILGRQFWKFPLAARAALGLAVALGASPARAQECQSDADCGFGFRCNQQIVSTTTSTSSGNVTTAGAVTTVGTTGYPPEVLCGDNLCSEMEDPDVCPEDCGIISFCEGASCESDSECAEGYACLPEHGIYSTTTTGSDAPLCGDRTCEEGEEACDTDCSTERTCQVPRCETDADCDEGFYCDPRGGSAVASVNGSIGGSGGGGTIELYLSDCLPLPTDGAGGNGGPGSGAGGSHGHGNGNGNNGGGHQPPWPHGPHRGCALAAAPASGSPLLAALAGLFACGLVQRRRRNG